MNGSQRGRKAPLGLWDDRPEGGGINHVSEERRYLRAKAMGTVLCCSSAVYDTVSYKNGLETILLRDEYPA